MTRPICPDCDIRHLDPEDVERLPDCYDVHDPSDMWQVEVVKVAGDRL